MGNGRVLRASIGAFLFASIVWLLFTSITANQASDKAATRASSTRNLNILTLIANRRHFLPRGSDFNSVTKRRVPNGPDPIHNRRAGNSRVPTTRA